MNSPLEKRKVCGLPASPLTIRPQPQLAHSPGRGGQRHKYLQTLIAKYGQDRGFRAMVEQNVLDGQGSVDVALERDGSRIGVEITVTTPTAHGLGSVGKCLATGFERVVLVAVDSKAVKRLGAAVVAEFDAEQRGRVTCLIHEDVPGFLDSVAAPLTAEPSTVAG